MKKSVISLAVLAAAGLATTSAVAGNLGQELQNNRFVIEYKNGSADAVKEAIDASGATIKMELPTYNSIAIEINSLEGIENLRKNSDIASIEVDAVRKGTPVGDMVQIQHTNDPLVGHPSLYGLGLVQADQLHEAAFGSGVKVCVMDTGYDLGHEDLPANADGTNDPGAGAWNDYDIHYHGTHVAGTIAARGNNGIGVTGVISNSESTIPLYISKVFSNSGGLSFSTGIVGGLEACIEAGANVVNMSLGGPVASKLEERAFERARKAGVLLIAAAGNDGNSTHNYPASYDSVMSVAAVDSGKNLASFSQTTSQVEVAAPGVGVGSTAPRNLFNGASGYIILSGTSMASPHVAGVAALVWSHYPHCSNYDIRNALKASAEDLGDAGKDYRYGAGLVQAKAMYDYLDANGCSGNICKGKECDPAK